MGPQPNNESDMGDGLRYRPFTDLFRLAGLEKTEQSVSAAVKNFIQTKMPADISQKQFEQ